MKLSSGGSAVLGFLLGVMVTGLVLYQWFIPMLAHDYRVRGWGDAKMCHGHCPQTLDEYSKSVKAGY